MIVVDASALLELLLRTEAGLEVERRIRPREETLHAPHLIDLEVTQVLRRYVRSGHLDESRAAEALHDLIDADIRRYDHDALLARIWQLRANASSYDAGYLALAEALGAPLLTRDAALAAVPGTRAKVVVL